jgi:hypothetical protein
MRPARSCPALLLGEDLVDRRAQPGEGRVEVLQFLL